MKAENFEDLIKRFNPFGFKDEKKQSMMFKDYGAVYRYTIRRLFEEYPRGYVDVPLFLSKMTLQPLTVTTMFSKKSAFIRCVNEGVYLCEPDENGMPPKECYANLMKAFHTLSETHFSQEYFDEAWEEFVSEE